jgi:serine kinase of HPr protein (carbohydrate metabolism regulator)
MTPTGSATAERPTPGDGAPERRPAPASEVVHATAIAWLERGLLLLGPSGSGKSDLALRLIEAGAALVADDLVRLEPEAGRLVARAHGAGGLIELRGQGIFRLPAMAAVTLDMAVALGPVDAAAERLPPPAWRRFAGIALPCFRLDPLAASAVARVRLLLTAERAW